jgi:hypothetical protein
MTMTTLDHSFGLLSSAAIQSNNNKQQQKVLDIEIRLMARIHSFVSRKRTLQARAIFGKYLE